MCIIVMEISPAGVGVTQPHPNEMGRLGGLVLGVGKKATLIVPLL